MTAVCVSFLISKSLKFPRSEWMILPENTFSSCILYATCFAASTSSPLDVPKGSDTTPTITTVVQIKHSLYFDL